MPEPSFVQRFFLALSAYFRILFDVEFAKRVVAAGAVQPGSTESPALEPEAEPESSSRRAAGVAPLEQAGSASAETGSKPSAPDGALQLLSLLQREGRFVDFIQQDVQKFSDAQIGQAARVVHEGCRATFRRYLELEPVLAEAEGSRTEVPSGFDARAIKLLGNVSGSAPYRGVLRHQGWRASRVELPQTLEGHAFEVLAPAEVEV